MEILTTFLMIIGTICAVCLIIIGFSNSFLEFEHTEFEHDFIETYKLDASKLRFIPRLFIMFFIFIIEYSYKLGVLLGRSLKFLIMK